MSFKLNYHKICNEVSVRFGKYSEKWSKRRAALFVENLKHYLSINLSEIIWEMEAKR